MIYTVSLNSVLFRLSVPTNQSGNYATNLWCNAEQMRDSLWVKELVLHNGRDADPEAVSKK